MSMNSTEDPHLKLIIWTYDTLPPPTILFIFLLYICQIQSDIRPECQTKCDKGYGRVQYP